MAQDSDLDLKVQELLKDARSADRIDKERAELFAAMLRTAAWLEYVNLLEAKLQGMADEILAPSGSIEGMIRLEYVKGAMSGLVLARDLPSVTIAAMDQLETRSNGPSPPRRRTKMSDENSRKCRRRRLFSPPEWRSRPRFGSRRYPGLVSGVDCLAPSYAAGI